MHRKRWASQVQKTIRVPDPTQIMGRIVGWTMERRGWWAVVVEEERGGGKGIDMSMSMATTVRTRAQKEGGDRARMPTRGCRGVVRSGILRGEYLPCIV